jgi:acetyl esterase/lipase
MSDANRAAELMARMAQRIAAGDVPHDALGLRKMMDEFAPLLNLDPPEVGAIHEGVLLREIGGARVTADVLVPHGKGPFPVLVYLHGGGWVAGSPRTHRKLGLRFAEAGFLVVNVDYRLAPEAPYPAPFDDCVFAVRWAAEQARAYGGDPRRLALGGDSAGGNLSAAVAAELAGDRDVNIRAALLIYGVFDFEAMGTLEAAAPSGDPEAAGKLRDAMIHAYVGNDPSAAKLRDPRVSPLHGAAKLPPSFLVVGTADPLMAQQAALAAALARAGIEHENVVLEGMPHGFVQMEFLPPALESVRKMVAFLRKHLA